MQMFTFVHNRGFLKVFFKKFSTGATNEKPSPDHSGRAAHVRIFQRYHYITWKCSLLYTLAVFRKFSQGIFSPPSRYARQRTSHSRTYGSSAGHPSERAVHYRASCLHRASFDVPPGYDSGYCRYSAQRRPPAYMPGNTYPPTSSCRQPLNAAAVEQHHCIRA